MINLTKGTGNDRLLQVQTVLKRRELKSDNTVWPESLASTTPKNLLLSISFLFLKKKKSVYIFHILKQDIKVLTTTFTLRNLKLSDFIK